MLTHNKFVKSSQNFSLSTPMRTITLTLCKEAKIKFQCRETPPKVHRLPHWKHFFFTHSALHNRPKAFFFPVFLFSQTHFNPVHKRVGWIWVSRLGVSQSQTCEKRNQSTKPPNYLSLPRYYIRRSVCASPQSHTVSLQFVCVYRNSSSAGCVFFIFY